MGVDMTQPEAETLVPRNEEMESALRSTILIRTGRLKNRAIESSPKVILSKEC
jgi:hypothetical protein